MLRRILSALLIVALLAGCVPAFAENFPQVSEDAYAAGDPVAMDESIYGEDESIDQTGEQAAAAYSTEGYATLQRGDRDGTEGARVAILQEKLIELGYLQDTPDGTYGGNTESAVKSFQRNNNLGETGIADSSTQALLYSGAELVSAYNSMNPDDVTYRVQLKLFNWGFSTSRPDSRMGKATTNALKSFHDYLVEYEIRHPVPTPEPVSAIPTPEPRGYADADVAEDRPLVNVDTTSADVKVTEQDLKYIDGEYPFDTYRQNVVPGDSGPETDRVQNRLNALKYLANVNGAFDDYSERALRYFQRKAGLPETGVADEKTQRALFADNAPYSEEYVNQYKIVVDVSDQRVYIYRWDGGAYSELIAKMKCSTGKRGKLTATPLGTYTAVGPSGTGEWYWFKDYDCFAKWGYYIVGGIMFHSVIYYPNKVRNQTSVKKLGHPASHGCIRLLEEHAEWIYKNCPKGTTVVVQE